MKKYRVLVLGASGAGKTIFLASMYRKLSVQNNEIGFFLETEPQARKMLVNKFRDIANPDLEWPAGTFRNEVSTWNFTCTIRSNHGENFPVFEFVYLDYSGELITHTLQESDEIEPTLEIESEVEKADALLVLLDGQKIFHYMQDAEGAHSSLEYDLSNLLPIIQRSKAMPVHFVVTKWDLLHGSYTLKEVHDRLLQFDQFVNTVEQRKTSHIPTRLIPVSSLGYSFATLNDKGYMTKKKNGVPNPVHVEMPLACTLMDIFTITQNQLRESQRSVSVLFKTLGIEVLLFLARILKLLSIPASGIPIVGILLELFEKGIESSDRILKRKQAASLEAIKNRDTAISSVIISQNRLMAQLEFQYPESIL